MKQSKPISLVEILFFILVCFIASYLYSCNDKKIVASVASTLTAQPTLTLRPTSTPKPTRMPAATPTLQDLSNRTDLLGMSFDYMISELEKIGFTFEIINDDSGNRYAYGKYIYNKMYDVELNEEGYSLVNVSYEYGYGSFTGDNFDTPGFDNVAKLIFGDRVYSEIVEPWYLEGSNRIGDASVADRVLCFDGYVVWYTHYYELSSVDTKIMVEKYYKEIIESYFNNDPPFEQCQ